MYAETTKSIETKYLRKTQSPKQENTRQSYCFVAANMKRNLVGPVVVFWICFTVDWRASVVAEIFRCNLTDNYHVDAYLYWQFMNWSDANTECQKRNRSLSVDRNITEECVLNLFRNQSLLLVWNSKFNESCYYVRYHDRQFKEGHDLSCNRQLFFICQEDSVVATTHTHKDFMLASKTSVSGGAIAGIAVGVLTGLGMVCILFVLGRRGKLNCRQNHKPNPSESRLSSHANVFYEKQSYRTDTRCTMDINKQATDGMRVCSIADARVIYDTAKDMKGGKDQKPESAYEYASAIVDTPARIKPTIDNKVTRHDNKDLSNTNTYDHINKPIVDFPQNVYSHTETGKENEYSHIHTSSKSSSVAAFNDYDTYNHLQDQVCDSGETNGP